MKKCSSCGASCQDWFAACPNCKAMFGQAKEPGKAGQNQWSTVTPAARTPSPLGATAKRPGQPGATDQRKMQPLAVIALFASLTCGIFGIIIGIIAIQKIRAEPQTYKGEGIAMAAIIIGVALMVLPFLLVFIGAATQ